MRTLGSNSAITNLEEGKIVFESTSGSCTVAGTLRKTMFMLLLTFVSGIIVYNLFATGSVESAMSILVVSGIGSFLLYLGLFFNGGRMHPIFYMLFAAFQGALFGGIAVYLQVASVLINPSYAGLFNLAIILTILYVGGLFVLYYIGLVQTSEKTRAFAVALGFAIILVSLVSFVVRLFGNTAMYDALYGTGPLALIISGLYLLFYSIFLISSFEQIEMSAQAGLPARAEWYLAFSLFHIIIEIFRTMLRILIQLASSSD